MSCEEDEIQELAAEHIIDDISENLSNFNIAINYLDNDFIIRYWLADKLYKIYQRNGFDALRVEAENYFGKIYTDEELFGYKKIDDIVSFVSDKE